MLQSVGVLTPLTGSGLILAGVARDSLTLKYSRLAFLLAGIGMIGAGGALARTPIREFGIPEGCPIRPTSPESFPTSD